MSENLHIGKIINDPEMDKDAIHVPVMPMVAGEFLEPGCKVMFQGNGVDRVVKAKHKDDAVIGVVDPFLDKNVKEGQKFWLFLYPGSISSLRHDWEHPTIAARLHFGGKEASEKWLQVVAAEAEMDYSELMDYMEDANSSRTSVANETYDLSNVDPETLWMHWERVTGRKAKFNGVPVYYKCC